MSSLRVIVMGIGGVGKSAITNRFVMGRWIEKYDPTVEESYQTTIDVDGRALQVEILDTAGQDEYTALRETFLHTGDGFLLVYSITDDQTVEELRGIREQILRIPRNRQIPIIVVGNKVDMSATDRAVSTEEGSALAEEFGASFIEVSAKDNYKVKEAFENLVRKIVTKKPDAGRMSGSGAVFGAGVAVEEPEAEEEERPEAATPPAMPPPAPEESKKSKKEEKKKEKGKSKCLIL
jgi:small GTP-binding protein